MKPFGVDFHEKDPRPYRERRQDMLRDVHANMDTFEAEKQERRILRMLKRGVTMAQFSEIAISIQRVRDIVAPTAADGTPDLDGLRAFVALPGGLGTFEELFEVWTWRHLAYHDRPIGLLDAEGYWAPMLQFLRHSVTEGFMGDDQMAMLHSDDQVERLLAGIDVDLAGGVGDVCDLGVVRLRRVLRHRRAADGQRRRSADPEEGLQHLVSPFLRMRPLDDTA